MLNLITVFWFVRQLINLKTLAANLNKSIRKWKQNTSLSACNIHSRGSFIEIYFHRIFCFASWTKQYFNIFRLINIIIHWTFIHSFAIERNSILNWKTPPTGFELRISKSYGVISTIFSFDLNHYNETQYFSSIYNSLRETEHFKT